MNLYVQIYDSYGAFTIYEIPQSITVYPHETNLTSLMNDLITEDPSSDSILIIYEGSFKERSQEIQRISSLLNYQSLSDKLGLILKGDAPIFPQTYGPLWNYSGVIAVILGNIYCLTDKNKIKINVFKRTKKFQLIFMSPIEINDQNQKTVYPNS
jgi:hypothetical protein